MRHINTWNGSGPVLFLAYLVAFACLCTCFTSCTSMSKSTTFNPLYFKYVPAKDERNHVLMKDSSIVYGKKIIKWGTGLLNKKILRVDGKQIPASEILAFQNSVGYWVKLENDALARRLVSGRISIYQRTVSASAKTTYTELFVKDETGVMKELGNLQQLKQILSDCPKAFDMINIPTSEYKKIIKKDPYYTQKAVETYNSCF